MYKTTCNPGEQRQGRSRVTPEARDVSFWSRRETQFNRTLSGLRQSCDSQAELCSANLRHLRQVMSLRGPRYSKQSLYRARLRPTSKSYITGKQPFQRENISDAMMLSLYSLAMVCTSSNKHFPNQLAHLEPTHQSLSSRIQFSQPLII